MEMAKYDQVLGEDKQALEQQMDHGDWINERYASSPSDSHGFELKEATRFRIEERRSETVTIQQRIIVTLPCSLVDRFPEQRRFIAFLHFVQLDVLRIDVEMKLFRTSATKEKSSTRNEFSSSRVTFRVISSLIFLLMIFFPSSFDIRARAA